MNIALRDTVISCSKCIDLVDAFNRVVFFVSKDRHFAERYFTSDCLGMLDRNGREEILKEYGCVITYLQANDYYVAVYSDYSFPN